MTIRCSIHSHTSLRHIFVFIGMTLACIANSHGQEAVPPNDPDWARRLLADDPLVKREQVSLQDIRDGLADPNRRGRIIADHFGRVHDASDEEKLQFLTESLHSEFLEVQQQAATELRNERKLEWAVHDLLVEFMEKQDPKVRNAAIVGLEQLAPPADPTEMEASRTKLALLADPDEYVALLTAHRLQQEEILALPGLIEAFKTGHPRLPFVVELLADIVYSMGTSTRFAMAEARLETAPTVGKGSKTEHAKHSTRELKDNEKPTLVTVYYGTNRELTDRPRPSLQSIVFYPFIATLLVCAIGALFGSGSEHTPRKSGCLKWLMTPLMLAGIAWALFSMMGGLQQYWSIGTGPSFGPKRDPNKTVHYGRCDISIPPRHEVGKVEHPLLGFEDDMQHVVIHKTEPFEEQAFFDTVKSHLAVLPKSDKSCFVFIHGFNVDFESAARRTAQIHYDLQFEGIPIFFSWPSRANVLSYSYDRAEIQFSHVVIKDFLINVAQRVDADRIHVIAHSMGADATCQAIAAMGERGKIFDQIVLAAPDIDRDVFQTQLAPRLTKTANRTTLYCSRNDLALYVSRSFNDSARAGDSSVGALVIKEVDTVDASEIDTDLLGHSYYGDCLPLLNDVQKLLGSSLPPQERKLRPWPVEEGLMYWTLPNSIEEPQEPNEL